MIREICDFCSRPDPTWEFPCKDFCVEHLKLESTGGWAACDECANLVCNRRWEELARRSMKLCPAALLLIAVAGEAEALCITMDSHRQFQAVWDGTCIPWVAVPEEA